MECSQRNGDANNLKDELVETDDKHNEKSQMEEMIDRHHDSGNPVDERVTLRQLANGRIY